MGACSRAHAHMTNNRKIWGGGRHPQWSHPLGKNPTSHPSTQKPQHLRSVARGQQGGDVVRGEAHKYKAKMEALSMNSCSDPVFTALIEGRRALLWFAFFLWDPYKYSSASLTLELNLEINECAVYIRFYMTNRSWITFFFRLSWSNVGFKQNTIYNSLLSAEFQRISKSKLPQSCQHHTPTMCVHKLTYTQTRKHKYA